MWNLPGPGLEPVSAALADGLLTTVPPGKSLEEDFKVTIPLIYIPEGMTSKKKN